MESSLSSLFIHPSHNNVNTFPKKIVTFKVKGINTFDHNGVVKEKANEKEMF